MYEEKFNTSFEAKLAKLKAEKQSRIDLVEAEKLRKATDPSEIEKVEASLWLQQELRDVGEIFVAKAADLGIKPTIGWSGNKDIGNGMYKTYTVYGDGLMKIEEYQRTSSDYPTQLSSRTNDPDYLGRIEAEIRSKTELKISGVIDESYPIKPIENYQFTVSSIDEGKKFLGETTTALVDILGDLATESGVI